MRKRSRSPRTTERLGEMPVLQGRLTAAFSLVVPLLAWHASCAVADPAGTFVTRPAVGAAATDEGPEKRKAAELVRALYASEAWIDNLETMFLNTRLDQTPMDAGPDRAADASRTIGWAWDKSRMRYDYQVFDAKAKRTLSQQTHTWDGTLAVAHSGSGENEAYAFDGGTHEFFEEIATSTIANEWEIASPHRFWWLKGDVDRLRAARFLAPDDFELEGQEEVNGRDCFVVLSRAGQRRLHIGRADGRLYRHTHFEVIRDAAGDLLARRRRVGGQAIRTLHHWGPWLESLEPEQRHRAERDLASAQLEFEFTRPDTVETLDDYREVAPGCWFPFRRQRDYFASTKVPGVEAPVSVIHVRLDITVTEMKVNARLADELFHIELKDGVSVQGDRRYDPPIQYTYKKDQPEAERLALRDAARLERDQQQAEIDGRLARVKSRVGKAPLALPEDGWVAGGPLDWKALRGKVVVLHFFDVTVRRYRDECEAELPVMESWHQKSAESPVVVIGVHRASKDRAAVEKVLAEFGANYPVLIDAPSEAKVGLGRLHEWFGTEWLPLTVLIDQNGLVAGYGQLWHGLIVDRKGIVYGDDIQSWMPSVTPQIERLTAPRSPR